MAVKVVTDSAADLPTELLGTLGVTVVPLTVHFGTESFRDGVDLTADEFFKRLTSDTELPKTSQPSVGAFSQVYSELAAQGHHILSIHPSAKLSGTYNSAVQAAKEVPEAEVALVDSMGASAWQGLVVVAAARIAQSGADLPTVAQAAREAVDKMSLYFMMDTLEYLQRGGRIGRVQALIGSALSIRPILTVQEGEVRVHERVRTRPKALERMKEIIREEAPYAEMAVLHSTSPEEMEALAVELQPLCPDCPVIRSQVGPVIGTHTGPGVLGVAARKA